MLAVGGGEDAARLMGLPVDRVKFLVYALSGTLAGLAGVILAAQFGAGQPTEGVGWELFAIASVVVGGTLLTGGVGSVGATLAGALLLGLIFNILNFENGLGWISLSAYWQSVIRGAFLLLVVILQSRLNGTQRLCAHKHLTRAGARKRRSRIKAGARLEETMIAGSRPQGCGPRVPDDAKALAELINFAGEGLPLYLWDRMAEPGETAWDVGRRRARRDVGGFSWRNATVSEQEGSVAACLIGYLLPEAAPPIDRWSRTAGQWAGRRVGSAGQGAACDHMRELPLTGCSCPHRSRARCRR